MVQPAPADRHPAPPTNNRNRRRADAGASCVSLKGTPFFYQIGLACSAM